jgi:hypothetical protein
VFDEGHRYVYHDLPNRRYWGRFDVCSNTYSFKYHEGGDITEAAAATKADQSPKKAEGSAGKRKARER